MAIRDKIRDKAQPQLQPGEQVQAVFPGQTQSQWLILAGYIFFFILNSYRCVVVTDRRIVVFDSGKFAQANPSKILYEAPRTTRLGPPGGLWHKVSFPSEDLRVHKRFHKDIEQADAQAGAAAA
ncbi:MAG TPA: hypothetical protein VEW93_09865 [Acidimicrobiales bacterium]|nr:hypothetical protein [Acidimicrobiales bacterium]